MYKIILIISLQLVLSFSVVKAQKIKVYFNKPVNTSVSTGVNAIVLPSSIDDTLVSYIDRAKFSIDIAVYNYSTSSLIADIAAAINDAYSRGVVIRWIYDGSSTNSGLASLNSGINKLASPTGANYTIMHNKFMIIDANSTNINDPIVCTGSTNWGSNQINSDVNHILFIQDKNLALAYTTEFNEMWGSTTSTPNLANSKFGSFKTDNTPHTFTIDGKLVELYFSPSDGTTSKIIQSINSANFSMYFGLYTFTENDISNAIINKIQSQQIYTLGIIDQFSVGYAPVTDLSPVMNNNLIIFNQNSTYHNKMLIVDPCNPLSDPQVLTGSHNWSGAANTDNDENTLIIHDDTIANIFYQSFNQNFVDLGGSLIPCATLASVNSISNDNDFNIYPNPAINSIKIFNSTNKILESTYYNSNGNLISQELLEPGQNLINTPFPTGIYLIKIAIENSYITRRILVQN